jgi:hypothetical protein
MPGTPLKIIKVKTQPSPRERKQLLHWFQATRPAAATQPAPAKSKPPIRYYQPRYSNIKRSDQEFGSKAEHHDTSRNKHALSKGYKQLLVAKAESGPLPAGHLPRTTASFGLYFTFENSYKQLIDSLRMKFLSRAGKLNTYKPLIGPEFPVFSDLPIGKQEKCQIFLQDFCAHLKPFDIDFIPDYHQPQNEKTNPRGHYRVGYSATSKNNKHQEVISEVIKVLWDGPYRHSKRRAVLLQPDIGIEEQAKRLRDELLSMGVQTFRVQGIVLRSRTAVDEQGNYKMTQKEFSLIGTEENISQAARPSREMLQDDKVETVGDTQSADPHKRVPKQPQEPGSNGLLAEELAQLWPA